MAARILGTLAGVIGIGFGAWHLFVPTIWAWYEHINVEATELVLAVRAINLFFSLCLVLLGGLSILFSWAPRKDAFFTRSLWVSMCILWGARVAMQLIYPQGSSSATLQYSMLAVFVLTFAMYLTLAILPQSRPRVAHRGTRR